MFCKDHSNKFLKPLTFFDKELSWENQVKYLGLIFHSKLTFRQHSKYNNDKFWSKVHRILPLVALHSHLSFNNKVLLFKQVLRPILSYYAQIWGLTAKTHLKKIQSLQNKILRIITNAPWFVRNEITHNDLHIESIEDHIKKLSRKFFLRIAERKNPLINSQIEYAHNNGKYLYPTEVSKTSRLSN
ncbi:RNA-directed DNA polymerase from mobile element jockey [Araneus ventricosus]|uniref:RNA-directed DNA polymerase from mobile element jockey n=1 Tax=Araneus ventricosus TaxID=182803 RepID=A0A4Y2F572_ARAVE|nr:RNA-directed DNA polymerase from mobile element jockey [Araneus ventricosus]